MDFIVAVDRNWGVSRNGKIPWKGLEQGREDLTWFLKMTKQPNTAVIMGRKTWDSIPMLYRPLSGRINIIITTSVEYTTTEGLLTHAPAVFVPSFDAAVQYCKDRYNMMIIGGPSIYRQAFTSPYLRYGYITRIAGNYQCDLTFPRDGAPMCIKTDITPAKSTNHYFKYDFRNQDELKYQELLRELSVAPVRPNRTDTPTRGVFHRVLKFNLYDENRGNILPLITLKNTNFKSIYHELIWFLRGSTNVEYLNANNVHIWDDNSTREFLDSRGLNYPAGNLGPIYGSQWRNWNGSVNPDGSVQKDGIDQLAGVIDKLKTSPWDRRMIVSAWNVDKLDDMALPPCHLMFQFHVDPLDGNPKYLNCLVNMRSADVALGVPFNIASYALLTHMIALITDLTPGTLSLSMADCHVYENHLDGIKLMLNRETRQFPTIEFSHNLLSFANLTIDDFANKFTIDDYIIDGYKPHPFIKLPMAI